MAGGKGRLAGAAAVQELGQHDDGRAHGKDATREVKAICDPCVAIASIEVGLSLRASGAVPTPKQHTKVS